MEINWTTVISSAVVAVIISGAQLIGNRYLSRVLDHLERTLRNNKEVK